MKPGFRLMIITAAVALISVGFAGCGTSKTASTSTGSGSGSGSSSGSGSTLLAQTCKLVSGNSHLPPQRNTILYRS